MKPIVHAYECGCHGSVKTERCPEHGAPWVCSGWECPVCRCVNAMDDQECAMWTSHSAIQQAQAREMK